MYRPTTTRPTDCDPEQVASLFVHDLPGLLDGDDEPNILRGLD